MSKKRKQATPNQAVRLTFTYEDGEIKLVGQQPVEMLAPPSDEVAPAGGTRGGAVAPQSGFWYQLEDAQGAALYRQIARNPIRADREVFAPDGEHSVQRAPVAQSAEVFTVVVPQIDKAAQVTLHSSIPADAGATRGAAAEAAARGPAQPIAAFKLTK